MNELKKYLPAIVFTLLYILGFSVWFIAQGNYEFILYTLVLIFFAGLITLTINRSHFDPLIIWGLALWGFLHMAGGGIKIGGEVLYALVLWPVFDWGNELILFKYDQIVHFFGFAVATLVVYHLLRSHLTGRVNQPVLLFIVIMAGIGLGALNEIVEFIAVLAIPDTNVGGYYNTGLDLIFNLLGASAAGLYLYYRREPEFYAPKFGALSGK
ncbi:MAG: DUF2238 domain-containing protein [Candidatus Paceibacterota bacterium]